MEFEAVLKEHHLDLSPVSIETLQVNVGKLCNQACKHCHVDAGPKRTEMMDRATIDRCLEILRISPSIKTLDITGGAPELNEHFDYLVREAKQLGRHVMVRHNLTVTLDPHPLSGKSMAHLPEFFRDHQCEVISSLPYFQEHETDAQRGHGVFAKSIESLRRLNAFGYGKEGSGLCLDLVYNPVGAFLPPSQPAIERQFKEELSKRHGLTFNNLFVITNMPINRFRHFLERAELYEEYVERLMNAFNPVAAVGVMCRNLISVGYDGTLYDCDFNQMLEWKVNHGAPHTIWDFDVERLLNRQIVFGSHCFGCTAGSGSSCGGAVVTF
ncbi:MAG: arsenosugar biosynthesis radical SAM (seleno)protein ArsS [Bacteroidota bacterium]